MLLFQRQNKVGNHHLQVAMFRCFSCKDPWSRISFAVWGCGGEGLFSLVWGAGGPALRAPRKPQDHLLHHDGHQSTDEAVCARSNSFAVLSGYWGSCSGALASSLPLHPTTVFWTVPGILDMEIGAVVVGAASCSFEPQSKLG